MELIEKLKKRRSYREFETETFDIQLLIDAIGAAKYAPSGANKQPWTFCIVKNPEIKKEIRRQAEIAESAFYKKIPLHWQTDLDYLNLTIEKPFLEEAPYLIVVFKQVYQFDSEGNEGKVYYPEMSVGIATGMLITVLTDMGLDLLTYTPSSDGFLTEVLDRPENEKPFIILVVGKGSKNYTLPLVTRKSDEEVIKIY